MAAESARHAARTTPASRKPATNKATGKKTPRGKSAAGVATRKTGTGNAAGESAARKNAARHTKPAAKRRRRSGRFSWEKLSDAELLDVRLCDLGVKLEGTWLERPIARLYEELADRNLRIRPHFWLSEEWFSPDGMPGIAIPFFLAHSRLMRLERAQMLEVEGGSFEWCMKILRHETGHAIQQAFRLHRRRRWQELFGHSTQDYPDYYQPRPSSKRYVLHLYFWYAQSHPDEDFAETFAVWMGSRSTWRRRYKGWHALRKLEYVDELMGELAGRPATVRNRRKVDPLSSIKKTLGDYYQERKTRHGEYYPDIYDNDLRTLFSDAPHHHNNESASAFLRRNRNEIRRMVAKWTGEYEFTLDQVMRDMVGRSRLLRLRVASSEHQLKLDFAILLTVRTMQYLYTSRDWHAL
jgi:hypothetical protein